MTSYSTLVEPIDGAYYLNFNFDRPVTFNHALSITLLGDHDLYICNLALTRDAGFITDTPLLTITGSGAGRVHLYNVKIAGNASRSGPCLSVAANGASVAASEFSSCSEGVRISASNTLLGAASAERYAQGKNIIHDNGIGIHQISGNGNKWGYNVIDNNTTAGIVSDTDVGRLAIIPQAESGETYRCARNADGTISSREIKFSGVHQEGTVAIYQSDTIRNQGRELAAVCNVGADGICIINNLNIPFLDSSCGLSIEDDYFINAIFTGINSTPFMLRAPLLRWKMPTVEVESPDMPIEAGVRGTGSDETTMASNEEYRSPPSGDPVIAPPDDDDDDTGA